MFKVIQWATGGVGKAAISYIAAHPQLELVGCWVSSDDKVGRDVGEICGLPALGVIATSDVEVLMALDADCVMYSPVMADRALVSRLLASGKNVVTPLGWFIRGTEMSVISRLRAWKEAQHCTALVFTLAV